MLTSTFSHAPGIGAGTEQKLWADGILSWREGSDSLDALLHEAATPGGISATVMRTMDRAGHPRIVERGLRAGVARAKSNARR